MALRFKKHDLYLLLFVMLVAFGLGLEMSSSSKGTVGMAYGASKYPCQDYANQCGTGIRPMNMGRCEQLKESCMNIAVMP